jgi:hypothetical protein
MICPKCGFEQPDNPECMRCGVIVSRYKGPAMGADALQPPAPPPPPPSLPLSGNETVRMSFTPPAPEEVSGGGYPPAPAAAMATAGGTVYEGPLPGAGGTVYGGPQPGAVRPPSFGVGREVKSGDLLNQTFSIYFANFVPFVLLSAIALAPLFIVQGIFLSSATAAAISKQGPSPLLILSLALLFLGAVFCPYFATGAITYGVFQQLRRQDVSLGDCLSQGLSAFPRVLGLAFLQGLMVGLALLACVVPGIILAIRWAVSVPAAVAEKTGASDSMSRSTFLTDGYRGDVFGFLFVLGAINIGLSLLVRLATAGNPTLNLLVSGLATLFTTGLSATGTCVLYYRLRSAKESIDVDQIASVFA